MTSRPELRHCCPYDVCFDNNGKIIFMTCGKWSCKACAKENANLWARRVKLHLDKRGGEWFFITFTLAGSVTDVVDAYASLPKLWDRLRKTVERAGLAAGWEYVAFVEGQAQRSGMPHFHIISNIGSPIRVKDWAVQCGFGHQASQSIINGIRAAIYCTKYGSKAVTAMPRSFRRVRCSQFWTRLPAGGHKPFYVRAKQETIQHYLVRVADITGKPLQDLADLYRAAAQKLH